MTPEVFPTETDGSPLLPSPFKAERSPCWYANKASWSAPMSGNSLSKRVPASSWKEEANSSYHRALKAWIYIYIAAGSSFDKWSWTAILPERSVSSVSVEVKQKPSFKTKNASGSPWIGFTLYFPFFSAHAKARLIICLRGHFAISIRSIIDIMPLEWYLPIPSFLEAKVWS